MIRAHAFKPASSRRGSTIEKRIRDRNQNALLFPSLEEICSGQQCIAVPHDVPDEMAASHSDITAIRPN
jgi:hypothetical protein